MFDSGYILLLLLAAILFYMWRGAGRSVLDMGAMLEKDHQHHVDAIKVIARLPRGATWKEYRIIAAGEENKGQK